MTNNALLEANQLLPYGITGAEIQLLDLKINPASLVCVVGGGNTGKTRYLRTMAALDPPLKGHLRLLGQPFWHCTAKQQLSIRRQVGFLGADTALLSVINALANVMLPAQYHQLAGQKEIRERAIEILKWLECDAALEILPTQLSKYQQRMVSIARCLILNPKILFIDEAFAFLDLLSWKKSAERYLNMVKELNIAVVLATHNLGFARDHADLILLTHPNGLKSFRSWEALTKDSDPYVQSLIQSAAQQQQLRV